MDPSRRRESGRHLRRKVATVTLMRWAGPSLRLRYPEPICQRLNRGDLTSVETEIGGILIANLPAMAFFALCRRFPIRR